MRTLSKSKLLAFRQCPKRLWLEVHQPELREDSPATKASFTVGHQVGDIARKLYDPKSKGALIDPQSEGFDAAFERTQELLQTAQPIFEAGFRAEGALAFADVMQPVKKAANSLGAWWRSNRQRRLRITTSRMLRYKLSLLVPAACRLLQLHLRISTVPGFIRAMMITAVC